MKPFIISEKDSKTYIKKIIESFNKGMVSIPIQYGSNIDLNEFEGNYTNDDRFIILTSGSTGKSKGVVLGEKALKSNANSLIKIHRFKKGDIHASCLPLNHVNALCMSVITIHLSGAKLEYFEGKDMNEYFKFIEKVGARTATIVPALIEQLCEYKPPFPSCLEYLITAAAPLSSELANKFYSLYGDKIVQGYGMSEGVNFSFTMPRLYGEDFVKEYIENTPPVGLPLADVEYCFSEIGEVLIISKSMFSRYQNKPKETEKVFINIDGKDWLKTGDIGFDRNGYLVLKGRIKEVINKGGETIYPFDVDNQWLNQGVCAFSFPVKSKKFDNEIGMCCSIENYKDVFPTPSAIFISNKYFTNTGKPKRLKMAMGMQSFNFEKPAYNSMIKSAINCAKLFADRKGFSTSSKKLVSSAESFVNKYDSDKLSNYKDFKEPVFDWMKINIDKILKGEITGEDFIKENPNGWDSLMNNLMGVYPESMNQIMQMLGISGKVLELGSGVGNLTKYINHYCEVISSDLSISFINKFYQNENSLRIDFNTSFDLPKNINAIVACNALHCANNKLFTLQNIYDKMDKGVYLILGEGEKFVNNDKQWAFDFIFQLFKGWHDNTGFLQESEWVELLRKVGFDEIRINRIRSGSDRLGCVIVCKK